MKPIFLTKLAQVAAEHEKLQTQLSDANIIADHKRFATLSKKLTDLEKITEQYHRYQRLQAQKESTQLLLSDSEYADLAKSELQQIEQQLTLCEAAAKTLLLPKDQEDEATSVFIEIRAAAGGDESCLFAADLLRMYLRYSENNRLRHEIAHKNEGTQGGFKEVVVHISAKVPLYGRFKFESGAHRVQRVPNTESQGRIHTSTCTVAVLPEAAELTDIEINKEDLRIDTYRSSGAGGQHVNTTDSAIRITHIPTGIVAECQQERSQHKNRAKAMALLSTRINQQRRSAQQSEQAAERKSLVGTGDRSERIRTYNYPQGRITDHRINLTLYKLEAVLEGDLDELIEALAVEHRQLQIAQWESSL